MRGTPQMGVFQQPNREWFQELAHLLFDQLSNFSLIGKSLSFSVLFRVNQHAIALHIEDAAATPDQPNI
jgi:hypothetical protein